MSNAKSSIIFTKKKIFVFVVLLGNLLYGYEECRLSHESMVLIAKAEKHPARKLGYPYLISFNKKKMQEKHISFILNFLLKVRGLVERLTVLTRMFVLEFLIGC